MAEETITVDVKEAMGCAFCEGTVTFGTTAEGDSVFHSIPTCQSFDKMPAPHFLTACRKKRDSN